MLFYTGGRVMAKQEIIKLVEVLYEVMKDVEDMTVEIQPSMVKVATHPAYLVGVLEKTGLPTEFGFADDPNKIVCVYEGQ